MRLTSGSPQEIRAMNSMIEKGPVTMMLVFRSTCPHCVTYKPIWEELCKTKGRTANMISMESDIYQKTPLGSEKPVTGVPTVLYVSPTGAISEVETPRDKKAMTEMIVSKPKTNKNTSAAPIESVLPSSEPAKPMLPRANSNLFKAVSSERKTTSEIRRMEDAIIPNTMLSENPLSPIPATPIPSEVQENQKNQRGGDPFSAFLLAAAQQAAPAAALLGAYAALPAKRSSGLGTPRKTRRFRRSRL
jgi:hypothetical protein